MPVDWGSNESSVFSNIGVQTPDKWEGYETYRAHIWIATSGTTQKKWVALSKEAFLVSADAVNAHLASNKRDVWLNALPLFHVGGLSIYARAYLSGAKVYQCPKWDVVKYREILEKATLSALVPAQVYDLVQGKYTPPKSLRAVVVGGDAISYDLYNQAVMLGWPLLPSYGMSECCSQVATAFPGSFKPVILPHMECFTTLDGVLQVKSKSLFTGYLYMSENGFTFKDPKVDGIFTTNDLAQIEDGVLIFKGRKSDHIKIGGESVSLYQLNAIFNELKPMHINAFLQVANSERLGYVIELIALKGDEVYPFVEAFNKAVMPYEKIRKVQFVESIPRTVLGKIIKSKQPALGL